ncbi:YbbR-like domain-containing protein [Bacillus kwashiorkori]|uniref:CdaR family protein n=1 Tax=Bacillus kwashiorkori TaxID=1522318 RepID=UPI000785E064|nr:CdaR family protein [Bacillus kwashiorkori]
MDKKIFDSFMESKWFVRILALILALLLYGVAYIEENGTTTPGRSSNNSTTVEDVKVEVYYDDENFVVTGVPQTVDVYIEGSSSLVQSAKNLRDFIVYVDLYDAKIGVQKVSLQIKDLSNKLTAKITPATITVNVQEKVTTELPVEAEFNRSALEDGYTSQQAIIEPKTVKITGAKDVISEISYVKAIIEVDGSIDKTFTQKANVSVLDRHLNKLDVVVEPESVEVTVPVDSPKKTVPIIIKQEGTPKEGIIIRSIEPVIREIIIFGKQKIIDEITSIEIPVDVSKYEKNEEITVPIKLPEGVTGATPESITVNITVEKEVEKEIKNIPITYNGLNDDYTVDFLSPEDGRASIVVRGPADEVNKLKANDFTIVLNLENYSVGEHEVNTNITGPEHIEWSSNINKVKILIENNT